MPMYPFKSKAQGALISEQETVSSETKASKTPTTSDPDAHELVEDRSRFRIIPGNGRGSGVLGERWQNMVTGYIEIKVDRNWLIRTTYD